MVHASAPLYTLCRKIEEKHGRMGLDTATGATSLQLYRHPPNEKNLLPPSQWHLRLSDLGMTGGTVEEQHQAIVYYNYVPSAGSALLQREPQLMLKTLTAEESEAYHEAQANRATEQEFLQSMEMNSGAGGSGGGGAAAAAAAPAGPPKLQSASSVSGGGGASASAAAAGAAPYSAMRAATGMLS